MDEFATYLLYAIALIFVVEGLLYAIFPVQIQRMMSMASDLPKDKFRSMGALMATFGVMLVWIFQKF